MFQRGAALIAVTAIIVVSSLLVATIYYFLNRGIEGSALQKKYQTAREASLGGIDVLTKEIIPAAINGTTLSTVVAGFTGITNAQVAAVALDSCFSDKLLKPTGSWAAGCDSTMDPKTNPDMRFTLSGVPPAQPFVVSAKIVDTAQGNSNTSGITLEGGGVAETQAGMINTEHFPYLYRVEAHGERQANPSEKANFTILYAY
jgi:hypothetical protein